MLFKDGQKVYLCPIRYYDKPMPAIPQCTVVGHQKTSQSLYVYSEEYGHEVYVSLPVFDTEERARAYAYHKAVIRDIEKSAEASMLVDMILEPNTLEEVLTYIEEKTYQLLISQGKMTKDEARQAARVSVRGI